MRPGHAMSDETEITDAMARLRDSVVVPPADPAREAALLAAFDARQKRASAPAPRFGMPSFQWMAAAATLVVITVSLNWLVAARRPQPQVTTNDQVADLSGFVAWPGASAWPPLESGSLMRVELPLSLLPTLGLSAPSSATAMVPADIVVGQDGFARAVRLVQQQ